MFSCKSTCLSEPTQEWTPLVYKYIFRMIILKISLWRCQAGALTSSCALIMILFINHEWIFGGSWDAEIRLQTTRQGMRDPHYQWIGSIRNRQGTSDDTDTQEGHKTSSIIWFLKFVLLLRRLMQALRHLIQIPRIMNPIITWSAWSEGKLMMIHPDCSGYCDGSDATFNIWNFVFSTEMSKWKSVSN